jgi:hypothetical protein
VNRPPLVALGLCLALAAGGGCRRPSACPAGHDEKPGPQADSLWCHQRGSDKAVFLQRYPEAGGRIRQMCRFTAGRPEGAFEGWHPNGKVWLKGSFLSGKPDGMWLQLDEQGQKVADGEYRDGRLVQGAPVAVAALCESVAPH